MKLPTLKLEMTEEMIFRMADSLGDRNISLRVRTVIGAANFVHNKCKTNPDEYVGFLIGIYHMLKVLAEEV